MSLFRREPETPGSSASPAAKRNPALHERGRQEASQAMTHIAPGTHIQGEITGKTEVLIDGELQGDVNVTSRVVVGTGGRVVGTIQARAVRVAGTVRGNVSCVERIEILESGTLEGDVTAPRVIISEGAFFKGKVEMSEKPKAAGRSPESSAQKKSASTSGRTVGAGDKSEGKR